MARLISPPIGLYTTSIEPLSGPRAVGASGTESIDGFVQTVSSPFGSWRWQFSFPPLRGQLFRRYRGWIAAMHGGANATRWTFFDPDMFTYEEAGVKATEYDVLQGVPWSNGMPWGNTKNWRPSRPVERVRANAASGATIIKLDNKSWGHKLNYGDYIGFFPFHFGLYVVTDVISDGEYRIWPSLRKDIEAGDYATLEPTLAMRLESENSATMGRGLVVADGLTVTMVEVPDNIVRKYFAE